jgi:hypothetical protein
MKKIKLLLPVFLLMAVACNNSGKTAANDLEKQADSLYKEVMHGHDIGMEKGQAVEKAAEFTKRAIDSISKLPAAAQQAAAGYKQQLDSLLKDLNYADFSMNKWMEEMKWDPSKIELNERIKYYTEEKMKVEKVKDAILNSLAKADSLLKKAVQ